MEACSTHEGKLESGAKWLVQALGKVRAEPELEPA